MNLTSLPHDVLSLVLETLGRHELVTLSLTCQVLYTIVLEYGWSSYLRSNPRPSYSLSKARRQWRAHTQARYNTITDKAWTNAEFVARPLCRTWFGKLQPLLAINSSRLVVAAGSTLYSYTFGDEQAGSSPSLILEGSISLSNRQERLRNITGLSFVEDGGMDKTFLIAFQDGAIESVVLDPGAPNSDPSSLSITRRNLTPMPNQEFIESLSSEANAVLALSANGNVRLSSIQDDGSASFIQLKSRSWTSYLSLQSSTPFAAFGTASTTPLNVHSIIDGQLSPDPFAILHHQKGSETTLDNLPSSAVYGISRGPTNSPWGSSPSIVVSGWYDGQVRCYDLRSSSRFASEPSSNRAALRPVLSLADRWSFEPIYSVACGGGSDSHIAAGTARHSVVSFWDVRSPKCGWSVHAPGNDPSPVYSVILESSRFFGATQSRTFVYDFGPDVTLQTYPPIPPVRGIDNLKHKRGSHSATYHVLRYQHNSSGLCDER